MDKSSFVEINGPIASRLFYESNIDNAEGMGEDLHVALAAQAHTLHGTYPNNCINSETRLVLVLAALSRL